MLFLFFSPSGYEVRKNYDQAYLVFYLPLDTKQNAEKLFEFIQPTQIFIVKYEFWANLIGVSGSRSVPIYLVSGLFRDDQIFFKWYGGFFRKVLKQFTNIFVQDEASLKRLKTINIRAEVSGDTRYDRVMQNSTTAKRIELVDKFCNGKKVFVVGSSWLEDDNVLMPLVNSSIFQSKVIIAPHEINESRLKQIESQLSKSSVRFSSFSGNEAAEVLIIDNIGMLMHLYQYANVAYVGGGFKTGLHNILEPASFGVPVIFGPNHQKFPEAKLFVDNGIGFEISKAEKLIETYEALATEGKSDLVLNFMNGQTGATDYVVKNL